MSYSVFENTIARLLTDKTYLDLFQIDAQAALADLDLTQDEKLGLINMNPDQLSVAALSFRKKRSHRKTHVNVIKIFFTNWMRKRRPLA
tara:strand:+ start:89026 stop:89292 length:267 start_codon:yes stop_codon:yes gene_type:complete